MKTLNDSGVWRDAPASSQPDVVRSSRWPHFALSVTATDEQSTGAWIQPAGPALLEEVATTLQRLGNTPVNLHSDKPTGSSFRRLIGRWCGWRNASARARHRSEGLADFGSVLSNTLEVLSDSMPRYAQWLGRQVVSGDEDLLLEIGAGTGTMTTVLATQSAVVAFEPSLDARRELVKRTSLNPNIRVVESLEECRKSGPFDSIVLVNVLEHIEHDVRFLQDLRTMLRVGGKVVVLSPAHNCLYSNFDASIGHVRRYTRKRLTATFQAAGFARVHVRYFNAVGALLWLIVNRFLKREAASSGQTRLYDQLIVPCSSFVDRLSIRPFGQSVVGVARVN